MESKFDTFYALEEEKKERILNAALEEFSAKPFKNASTNAIAKKAKIGKGMLFYYFGSKQELFEFLCEYTVAFAKHEYLEHLSCDSKDFMERQLQLAAFKNSMIQEHPQLMSFLGNFFREENQEQVKPYLKEMQEYRDQVYRRLYEDVDESLFLDSVDPKQIMKYMSWLLDRYGEEVQKKWSTHKIGMEEGESLEKEWEEYYNFIADLKALFYKKEKE
jgi:AcrR family transcriptional regulator